MTGDLRVVPASMDDVDTVAGLLSDAARWMIGAGIDQWPSPFPREIVVRTIQRNETYLASIDDRIVGSIALYDNDPSFWGARPPDALYVHRLVVSRDARGEGLGARLLDWAADQAVAGGRAWLRLDTGAGNQALRGFYERLGFVHVGDVVVNVPGAGRDGGAWRGSLYERTATWNSTR